MVLQVIPVERFDSYKCAATFARAWAIKTKVLHTVKRDAQGEFQVCRSSKGRLKEFQVFADKCGYSFANFDTETLRNLCLLNGLSPAGWRFIHWNGESAFEAIFRSNLQEERLFDLVLIYVEWQVRARLKSPLPIILGRVWMQVFAEAQRSLTLANPKLALVASRHWDTLQSQTAKNEFANFQWARVLEWVRDSAPKLNSNQYHSGWHAIWHAYQKSGAQSGHDADWQSCLPPSTFNGFEVVPLDTEIQVELEGEAMDHCVADYIGRCQIGDYRLFSVRDSETQERIATVGLECAGHRWKLDQVKGLSNSEPSRELHALATEVARRYQLATENF